MELLDGREVGERCFEAAAITFAQRARSAAVVRCSGCGRPEAFRNVVRDMPSRRARWVICWANSGSLPRHLEEMAQTDQQEWPKPGYAWYALSVISIGYIFAFVDRIVIGMLTPDIIKSLHLTDTEMGLLQGLAFALFYTV